MSATTSSMDLKLESRFLIANLHCPTCSSHIEQALSGLRPAPDSISTSIVSHVVTITHTPALSVTTLSMTLEEAGFEVFDVILDPSATTLLREEDITEHKESNTQFAQAIARWAPNTSGLEDEKRRKHNSKCEMCLSHRENTNDLTGSLEETDKIDVVVATKDSWSPLSTVIMAIDGMNCSSCVGSVTRALQELPWVRKADVNLINNSANIVLQGEGHEEEIIKAVQDTGFGASVQQVGTTLAKEDTPLRGGPASWQATFAIEGMTCASCVNSISTALQELTWITDVNVNLLTNSVMVKYEGDAEARAREVVTRIEAAGFDARLDHMTNVTTESVPPARRKISITIRGMYCEHCPPKISTALKLLSEEIRIENLPTTRDPLLKISYPPSSPALTVRQILRAISDIDETFEPVIYKSISLEERSKRMQKREQLHMLYRFTLALVAAIPSLIIGVIYMSLVSSTNGGRLYLEGLLHGVSRAEWALFITATPVYFFAADVFHRRTLKELHALWRIGSPVPLLRRFYRFGSMNMLISFGTTIAYFASIVQIAIGATRSDTKSSDTGADSTYFDSVVFLTMFLLLGRLIEAFSKAKTGSAVAELGKLRPSHAMLIGDREDEKTSVDLLDIGDVVRVPQGSSPPFDGIITDGKSLKFDESSLTGESRLVSKSIGDDVFSGTINKGGSASVRLTKVSGDSMLDQIIDVVREGQARRAPAERVADAITGYFVPFVTLVAICTWMIWMALGVSDTLPISYLDSGIGGWPFWSLRFAIAVFVVACPCGIGLASPTALFVGGGLAARYGILVKGGGEAFQEASNLDCIVFDKTGTLTEGGEPKVTDFEVVQMSPVNLEEADIVGAVLATENQSTHPIAKSLVSFCKPVANLVGVEHVGEIPGKGILARTILKDGRILEVAVGNERLLTEYDIIIPSSIDGKLEQWMGEGKSIALVAVRLATLTWQLASAFAISDPPRPEARHVVESLRTANIDVWMLSGDNAKTALAVGTQVGIPSSNIIAGVLPSGKAEKIKYLQSSLPKRRTVRTWHKVFPSMMKPSPKPQRATVAMVGDGINDSPALTSADVGIAIGTGSDVAITSAAFVLISSELTSLLTLVHLSRAVFRRIKFNFAWALVYNCMALPVAAGVLYPVKSGSGIHIRLDPVWASLAMALSSISVVCSSLLLRSRLPGVGFRVKRWQQGDT